MCSCSSCLASIESTSHHQNLDNAHIISTWSKITNLRFVLAHLFLVTPNVLGTAVSTSARVERWSRYGRPGSCEQGHLVGHTLSFLSTGNDKHFPKVHNAGFTEKNDFMKI